MSEHTFPDRRICPQCPHLTFKGLEDHAQHLATHNGTPQQWAEAYKRIQAGKDRAKKQNAASD